MDKLQASMLRLFVQTRKLVDYNSHTSGSGLYMLYPDGHRIVAREIPFCHDHWLSPNRSLEEDLEALAAELTGAESHRMLHREIAPGFMGIAMILNGNFRRRGPLGEMEPRHCLFACAMTTDDRTLYMRHDIRTSTNEVLSQDDDGYAPELEQLRQLLWTIEDLLKLAPAPDPLEIVVIHLPSSASGLASADLLPQWAQAAREAGAHIL